MKVHRNSDKRSKQTAIEIAEVVSVSPLRIKLKSNDRLILDRNMIKVTAQVDSLITNGYLFVGNKVLTVISKGHQEVFVIDKIL